MREGGKTVTEEHLAQAIPRIDRVSLIDQLKHFGKMEQLALAGFVVAMWQTKLHPALKKTVTTERIYHYYKECAELNDLKPVTSVRMKEHLGNLELSEIIKHDPLSYKDHRGRTNVYWSPDRKIEDLAWALHDLGIKLPKLGTIFEWGTGKHQLMDTERPNF